LRFLSALFFWPKSGKHFGMFAGRNQASISACMLAEIRQAFRHVCWPKSGEHFGMFAGQNQTSISGVGTAA
jgi:hypothetical protein